MLTICWRHSKSSSYVVCLSCTNCEALKRFTHRLAKKIVAVVLEQISKVKKLGVLKKLYQTLGVDEGCEDESLRLAFVHLAKRFHPDSGTPEADAVRFSEIEHAYRQIKKIRSEEKEEENKSSEVKEYDIKHTAPQHRHYLNHDVGIGTPSRRQRLYTIERAQKAAENVMEHRLKKIQAAERNTLMGIDKQRAKDIKTRYGMDRLVEDLIQEAMNRGEFNDLPGMGKPLKSVQVRNPFVDFTTHKLNEILIDNGFTPEWIQLSKEIREETKEIRKRLREARNNLGSVPLNSADEMSWTRTLENLEESIKKLNSKIDKYNLLVPILQKQMLHVQLEILAAEALANAPTNNVRKEARRTNMSDTSKTQSNDSLFSLISSFFH